MHRPAFFVGHGLSLSAVVEVSSVCRWVYTEYLVRTLMGERRGVGQFVRTHIELLFGKALADATIVRCCSQPAHKIKSQS